MKGRTYRYFTGEPLFPFGYGLSYTTFNYSDLSLPASAKPGDEVRVSVRVRNTGNRAGEEVVQLYVKTPGEVGSVPIRSLAGFERVALEPGEQRTVEFVAKPRQFAHYAAVDRWVVEPGTFEVSVGGKQPGGLAAETTGVLTKPLRLEGPAKDVN